MKNLRSGENDLRSHLQPADEQEVPLFGAAGGDGQAGREQCAT